MVMSAKFLKYGGEGLDGIWTGFDTTTSSYKLYDNNVEIPAYNFSGDNLHYTNMKYNLFSNTLILYYSNKLVFKKLNDYSEILFTTSYNIKDVEVDPSNGDVYVLIPGNNMADISKYDKNGLFLASGCAVVAPSHPSYRQSLIIPKSGNYFHISGEAWIITVRKDTLAFCWLTHNSNSSGTYIFEFGIHYNTDTSLYTLLAISDSSSLNAYLYNVSSGRNIYAVTPDPSWPNANTFRKLSYATFNLCQYWTSMNNITINNDYIYWAYYSHIYIGKLIDTSTYPTLIKLNSDILTPITYGGLAYGFSTSESRLFVVSNYAVPEGYGSTIQEVYVDPDDDSIEITEYYLEPQVFAYVHIGV